MMREHPIIFSAGMVSAILAGTKTQTRRVLKPQPSTPEVLQVMGQWHGHYPGAEPGKGLLHAAPIRCPYGRPGDHLWVRETWALMCREADPHCWCETDEDRKRNHYAEYRADAPGDRYPGGWPDDEESAADAPRWRPSIHMPRWASRLTLEVCGVRVERLQAITPPDAIEEGAVEYRSHVTRHSLEAVHQWEARTLARDKPYLVRYFANMWDDINGKRPGCAWADDPFVWAVSFRVLPPPLHTRTRDDPP